MHKKTVVFLLLVFLLLVMTRMGFISSVMAEPAVIRVPADYPTIQMAIDAASPGDVVLVTSGTYYEHVTVNKSLTLLGEDRTTTIIDGNGTTGNVVSVTANNVVIDGFTIRNSEGGGVYLHQSNGSVITSNTITSNKYDGVRLYKSQNNTISGNTVLNNGHGDCILKGGGVALGDSNNNTISRNTIGSNFFGVLLNTAWNNTIIGNTMTNNQEGGGIGFINSIGNTIHHNNFFENTPYVVSFDVSLSSNTWDNGTEGNYWSDYTGLDDGSDGRVMGDGVGDTDLPHQGVDYYPLIVPWGPIPIVWDSLTYPVTLLSNSTVSAFRFLQANKRITFDVTGPPSTVGFCNVTIPKTLLRDNPWKVLLNDTDITTQTTITENETHTSLHFTYTHSIHKVQIIGTWVVPEFPVTIILPLFIIISLFAVILRKRRL